MSSEPQPDQTPAWVKKLGMRIASLPPGRHAIILTVDERERPDWTVQTLGKVER